MANVVVNVVSTGFEKLEHGANRAARALNTAGVSASRVASGLKASSAGLTSAGSFLTRSVTLPLTLAGGAALKFASDFDSAMTQSIAIMSEFSSNSELSAQAQMALRGEMEATARTVAKELNIGARDAAQSFFFLASAGLDAEQQIAAMPQVAAFAKAGMFDMATATDLATDAQSALGLTVKDAQQNLNNLTRVTDVLVKANTLANASVEQFSQSLTSKAGAALKILGKDIEEGVAVLAAFADQGVKAQDAGTGLNIILRDLSTKAIKNAEAFKENNIAVFDSAGEMNNLADVIGDIEKRIDGMSDAQAKATLLQLGFADKSVIFIQTLLGMSDKIRDYEENLRQAGGTTRAVADEQLKAFSERMGLVQKRVVDMAITLGTALMPVVEQFVDMLDPAIDKLADWIDRFSKLDDQSKRTAVALAGVGIAAGPALFVLGQVALVASSVVRALSFIGPAAKIASGGLTSLVGSFKAAGLAASTAGGVGFQSFAVGAQTAGASAVAAAGGIGGLGVAAAGAAGVISAQLVRSLDELGGELSGADDHIERTVEKVGLVRGALSLWVDVAKGVGRIVFDLGQQFVDAASKIPVINTALDVGKVVADKLSFAYKALAVAVDEAGDKLANFLTPLFEVDNAARDATVATAQLYQASQIAGRTITDQGEAARIVADHLDLMQMGTEVAAMKMGDLSAESQTAEERARLLTDGLDDMSLSLEDATTSSEKLVEAQKKFASSLQLDRLEQEEIAYKKLIRELEFVKALKIDLIDTQKEFISSLQLDKLRQEEREYAKLVRQLDFIAALRLDNLEEDLKKSSETTSDWNNVLSETSGLFQILGISAESALGKIVGLSQAAIAGTQNLLKSISSGDVLGIISSGIGLAATGVQAIAGLFSGRDAHTVMEEAGRDMGVSLSEGLANQINESGRNIQTFLPEIFAEGGLGVDRLAEEIGDIFSVFERGEISRPEAFDALQSSLDVLMENLDQLGPAGEDQIRRIIEASQRLGFELDILPELAVQFGVSMDATADQIQAAFQRAGGDVTKLVDHMKKGATDAAQAWERVQRILGKIARGESLGDVQSRFAGRVGIPVVNAKHGFDGFVNSPTMFVTGEGNRREHVRVTPLSGSSSQRVAGGGGVNTYNITVPIRADNVFGTSDEFKRSVVEAVSEAVQTTGNVGGINDALDRR